MVNRLIIIDGTGVPDNSIDFETSSSQYLSMSSANFGAFNTAKFAISLWFKQESVGFQRGLISQWDLAGNNSFRLFFTGGNKLDFLVSSDGTSTGGVLLTTDTYSDTSSWHHLLVHYDSANATANSRMRLWYDGSEITTFDARTNPSSAVLTSSATVVVGASEAGGTQGFDGLIYQLGFFSGSLPAIGSVYNAGSPLDIKDLTGLYAYLDVNNGAVTSDGVLVSDWTNNNTATASTTVPL